MKKPSHRSKFSGACIAAAATGIALGFVGMSPSTAGADEPADNAAQSCLSALQGEPDAQLVLSTDPADGPLAVGDSIEVTLTWGTADGDDVWSEIDKVLICMTVDGELDESSIFEEKPGVDDGTASTTFTVPEGAEEVCVHGRVSGNPGPDNDTDSTHKTGQTCFPIGDTPDDVCEEIEGIQTDAEECDTPDDVCEEIEGIQTDPEECDTPDDVCEEIEGIQTDPADCEEDVLPSTETPEDPADPATPPTEVAGTVTLPVTGTSTVPLAALALGLIALGRVLVTRSRKITG